MDFRPFNILYVIPSYKPAYDVGGPIVSVSSAAEALVARGHKVVVFTTNSDGEKELDIPTDQSINVDGVEVWYFRRKEPLKSIFPTIKYFSQSIGYRYSPQLSRILKTRIYDFDLVHTHAVWAYPTLAAGRIAIKAEKPLFFHQRGEFHPDRLKYRGLKKKIYLDLFVRPIVKKSTMLIALNTSEKEYYQSLGFNNPCRIIPNGIDANSFYQKPANDISSIFPIGPNQILILFMSRLHTYKGADILVDAFIKIAHKVPNSILVVAGPDEHHVTEQLKRKSEIAGLANRVLFPGMVSGQLKLNLLARADLFCLPSVAEGFSMAILEAMASATPVLITPGCNFPEISKFGAGVIVERDIESWSQALVRLLLDPDQLPIMGKRGFSLIKQRYTWEIVIDQLEKAYLEGIAIKNGKKIIT